MDKELVERLDYCAALCRKLESLLERDTEELSQCVTGDVYDAYLAAIADARGMLQELKHQIYVLHNEQFAIM